MLDILQVTPEATTKVKGTIQNNELKEEEMEKVKLKLNVLNVRFAQKKMCFCYSFDCLQNLPKKHIDDLKTTVIGDKFTIKSY